MKRCIALSFVLCFVVAAAVGCTPAADTSESKITTTTTAESPTTTVLPTTTTTTFVDGIGGGGEWDFSRTYHLNFSIDVFVEDLVGREELDQWHAQFLKETGTRNRLEYNYYELIQHFAIPRSDFESLLSRYDSPITAEDVNMLYTGTRLEVYQYFANPYAVMVGIYAYSPQWLATHTAEEYREVGITYEILNAKLADVFSVCSAEVQQHIRTQLAALA